MALTLTDRQKRLIEGAPLQPVYLHVVTTYTDQAAKAVDTVRYFADRPLRYDYGNTGTEQQFLPYVLSTSREHIERMPHLPSGGSIEGELLRSYTVSLRNVTPQGGTSLLADFRAELFEFSTLEVSELFIDPAQSPPEDPADLAGDEHVVLFRGEMDGQPREIDSETFTLRFVTERFGDLLPLPVTGSTVSLRDAGKRLPAVYGDVKRLPLLAVVVGAQSTVSQPMPTSATQVSLSDGAAFPNSGTAYIGGERVTFQSRIGNVLQGLARDPALQADHSPGEIVVEVPAGNVVYAVGEAGQISDVLAVWMRSPETGELFRLNDGGLFFPSDATSLPGHELATLQWSTDSWADVLQEIIANARVTQQPGFEDPADPVTTTTDAEEFDTDLRVIKNGQEGWNSPGKADGTWDTGQRAFSYDEHESDRKLAANVDTPLPSPSRDPERARIHVVGTVTALENVDSAEIRVSVVPPVEINAPLWATLPAISADVVGGVGSFEFYGAYRNNPDRADPELGDSTTAELGAYELHAFFRVHEGRGAGPFVFEAQITSLEIDYDYVSGGALIPISSAVEISGFSGGAGVEIFADVLGPVVPASNYVAGYGFPASESWDDTDATASDVADGVKLVSNNGLVTQFSLLSDASNWTAERAWMELADDPSPPAGMSANCLRLTVAAYEEVCQMDPDDWAGTVDAQQAGTANRMEIRVLEDTTTYTENTALNGGTVDCTSRRLHFPFVAFPAGPLAINPLDIHVGSSATDYWTFRYDMSAGSPPNVSPIDIDINTATVDDAYHATT